MGEPALLLPALAGDLLTAEQRVRAYLRNSRAANTYRAYRADWEDFARWCAAEQRPTLPATAETLMLYLAELGGAGKRISTVCRRATAITQVHKAAGLETPATNPAVGELLADMRRTHGTAPETKDPLLSEDVRLLVKALGGSPADVRNRALLLLGFAGAFRRSELVSLNVEDLQWTVDGLVVLLRRGKSDQEAKGRELGVPFGSRNETCPVAAVRCWIEGSDIDAGALFRPVSRYGHILGGRLTPTAVALIVKKCAEAAGLDPARYSGHSLRAGFATSAALGGAPEWAIMRQTGHRSRAMLSRYVRPAGDFRNNPVPFTGL